MTTYCNGKNTANVSITFADGKKDNIIVPAPVNVEQSRIAASSTSNKRCWNFYSQGGEFTLLACCNKAEYRDVGGNPAGSWQGSTRKMGCFCDGIRIGSEDWYYGNGWEALSIVSDINTVVRGTIGHRGDCNECQGEKCRVLVGSSEIIGTCPSVVIVACDGDCPPGYCKCITSKYPGYCCLPCKDVATKINRLARRCNCG